MDVVTNAANRRAFQSETSAHDELRSGRCAPWLAQLGTTDASLSLCLIPVLASPPSCLPSLGPGLLSAPVGAMARTVGTMKALTPAAGHHDGGSPHFSARTFLAFHPQPHGAPGRRFSRHGSATDYFQASPLDEQARRNTPPNRVRSPTDRKFASGCSPPRLTAAQLPSATGLWPTPARTYTALIRAPRGRTRPREGGGPVCF